MSKKYILTATVLNKKGKILAIGINSYEKTHPLMLYFAKKIYTDPKRIYKHAELDALLKVRSGKPHTIYVQRVGKNNKHLQAKPCEICHEIIKAFGIKVFKYTTETGIKEYKVKQQL